MPAAREIVRSRTPQAGSRRPTEPGGSTDPRWTRVVVVTSAAVGVVLAAYPLTLPHLLTGVHGFSSGAGYDDGVYLGAALRVVHGALPYRDFTFVHPPGIALIMAPLAALSRFVGERDAMALARIATVLVAGINSALASLSVRHRGIGASVTAGMLLAGFPGAYNADHTLLLEPWLVFFCLLAFVTLFPQGDLTGSTRRLVLAGVLAGWAGTVKVWAILVIVPLLVTVLLLRRRRCLPYLVGLVAGFGVPCLPFFILAPRPFLADVVVAQVNRSTAEHSVGVATRLGIMSGLTHYGQAASLAAAVILGAVLVAAVATVLVLGRGRGRGRSRGRGRARPAEWCAAAVLVTVVAGLFLPAQFYDHYAYFSATFLAVTVAMASGLLTNAAAHLPQRHSWLPTVPRLTSALLPIAVCVCVAAAIPYGVGTTSAYFADATDPGALVAATVPANSCVVFDDPVLLIAGNRFDTPRADCPRLVDPFGLWLTEDSGARPHLGGPFPQPFVDQWSRWLAEADYLVLSVPGSDYLPFSPALIQQFNATYRLVGAVQHTYIYARVD